MSQQSSEARPNIARALQGLSLGSGSRTPVVEKVSEVSHAAIEAFVETFRPDTPVSVSQQIVLRSTSLTTSLGSFQPTRAVLGEASFFRQFPLDIVDRIVGSVDGITRASVSLVDRHRLQSSLRACQVEGGMWIERTIQRLSNVLFIFSKEETQKRLLQLSIESRIASATNFSQIRAVFDDLHKEVLDILAPLGIDVLMSMREFFDQSYISELNGPNVAHKVFFGTLGLAIWKKEQNDDSLQALVEDLTRVGQFETALAVIKDIPATWRGMDSTFKKISDSRSKAGRFDRALALAKKITDQQIREGAIASIVYSLEEAGQFAKALSVIKAEIPESEKESSLRECLLGDLSTKLAHLGRMKESFAVTQDMQFQREFVRMDVCQSMVMGLVQAGLFKEAITHIKGFPGVTSLDKGEFFPSLLMLVIEGLVKVNRMEEALLVIHDEVPSAYKTQALRIVVQGLSKVHRFAEALLLADGMDEGLYRDEAFEALTKEFAMAGRFDEAVAVAGSAGHVKGRAMGFIGQEMIRAGRLNKAKTFFERETSVETHSMMVDALLEVGLLEEAKVIILGEIPCAGMFQQLARERVKRGQVEKALVEATSLANERDRSLALSSIIHELIRMGYLDKAYEVLQMSGLMKQNLEQDGFLMNQLAVAMARKGRVKEACTIAQTLMNAPYRKKTFMTIALELLRLDDLPGARAVIQCERESVHMHRELEQETHALDLVPPIT